MESYGVSSQDAGDAVRVPPVVLVGRQPVHAMAAQSAMHGGAGVRERPLATADSWHRSQIQLWDIAGPCVSSRRGDA